MTPLHFRKAVPADLDWLVATEQECFGREDAFSRRTFDGMIKNAHGSVVLDILEIGSLPIGYAAYLTRQKSAYIRLYSVCLLPVFRGQGLVEDYLKGRIAGFAGKYQRMGLEVRLGNVGAKTLYTKLGFTVQKLLKGYYANGLEDGYRMMKELIPV